MIPNVHSLKSMSVCQMVHTMLKKKNIVNIGILGSKITGGTFVNTFANDLIFSTCPSNNNQLFSGKRVTANILKGTDQIPDDFGTAPGVMKSGLADITLESRKELKDTISKLAKIILKVDDLNTKKVDEAYENPEDFKKTASTTS